MLRCCVRRERRALAVQVGVRLQNWAKLLVRTQSTWVLGDLDAEATSDLPAEEKKDDGTSAGSEGTGVPPAGRAAPVQNDAGGAGGAASDQALDRHLNPDSNKNTQVPIADENAAFALKRDV